MDNKKESAFERRKYIRLSAIARVEYSIIGEECSPGESTTTDMSRDGVRFAVSERLKKGALLDLKIDIGKGEELIAAKVETVWCRKVEGGDGYDVGALFVKINPADKDRLLDYAYRSWVEKAREAHRRKRST